MFNDNELTFLRSQRLARLATVEPDGQPNVDAVGFEFDGARFIIGGHNLPGTRKYRSVAAGNDLVSLIIDDLESVDPWRPRGIKLHGSARIERLGGQFGEGEYLVITPRRSWSWGVGGDDWQGGGFSPRRVVWPGHGEE